MCGVRDAAFLMRIADAAGAADRHASAFIYLPCCIYRLVNGFSGSNRVAITMLHGGNDCSFRTEEAD